MSGFIVRMVLPQKLIACGFPVTVYECKCPPVLHPKQDSSLSLNFIYVNYIELLNVYTDTDMFYVFFSVELLF